MERIIKYILLHFRIVSYLAFHAYSQMWLLPYAYKDEPSPYQEDLMNVAEAATVALKSIHNTKYQIGPAGKLVYPVHGSSTDWAHEKMGIKYSYVIELRPVLDSTQGYSDFVLPVPEIKPTLEETWAGLEGMTKAIAAKSSAAPCQRSFLSFIINKIIHTLKIIMPK